MTQTKAFAALHPKQPLQAHKIERRTPGEHDVAIDIKYCGVCHSDIHQARDEWGRGTFPMVPGHEIVGIVSEIGSKVTHVKVGDPVGVGCFVDSCRTCDPCQQSLEQYCTSGMNATYNSFERDGKTPTYGGYSEKIVVDEKYVLKIPKHMPLDRTAPLLCAGITTYSPLKQWNVKKGDRVGIIGLGGLGHMAIKFAVAMGAEVTLFSSSDKKREDAKRLGVKNYVNTSDANALANFSAYFNFILNSASANINLDEYLNLLKLDGSMVLVGAPENPAPVSAFSLIMQRRRLAGSLIGGIKETQEMLDFCGEHEIYADIEIIPIQKINEAYERMMKSDVKYRFVIDMSTI